MTKPANPQTASSRPLILASGSAYRRELLAKLGMPFSIDSPSIDEEATMSETPAQLCLRLAEEKSRESAKRYRAHLIIGSDQVAMLDGLQLGKPGSHPRAVEQLLAASGKTVEFFTGVCVLDSATGKAMTDYDRTVVRFRPLTVSQIEHYVERERPFDCAGSFKSEGLGIALFETLETTDPNALVGLPLIRLIRLLGQFGVEVL